MIALVIILAVLLLILTVPLGVDAAYGPEQSCLKLKIGLFRKTLLPRAAANKKPAKKKPEKKPSATSVTDGRRKKRKLTLEEIISLAEILLKAVRRFCARLSVDYIRLHWTAAAADPYDAVLQYGRINEGLGIISGLAHRAFKIREEDVATQLDLNEPRPIADARIVLSIQVWELIWLAACTGIAGLRWLRKKKRTARAAAAAAERSMEDGEHEHRESDGSYDAEDS